MKRTHQAFVQFEFAIDGKCLEFVTRDVGMHAAERAQHHQDDHGERHGGRENRNERPTARCVFTRKRALGRELREEDEQHAEDRRRDESVAEISDEQPQLLTSAGDRNQLANSIHVGLLRRVPRWYPWHTNHFALLHRFGGEFREVSRRTPSLDTLPEWTPTTTSASASTCRSGRSRTSSRAKSRGWRVRSRSVWARGRAVSGACRFSRSCMRFISRGSLWICRPRPRNTRRDERGIAPRKAIEARQRVRVRTILPKPENDGSGGFRCGFTRRPLD